MKTYLYICSTDWNYELGEKVYPPQLYHSIEDLKAERSCWEECGITKVEVIKVKEVVKGSL